MQSFQLQMQDILDDVYLETKKVTEEAFKAEAKETASYLRQISPKQKSGARAGKYARGWRWSWEYGETIVYNQTDWQLAHLLEDGHDIKNRFSGNRVIGHYGGVKHIMLAEERAGERLPLRISRGLR